MFITKFLWFLIFIISLLEMIIIYVQWFRFLGEKEKSMGSVLKNFLLLTLKSFIPGILAIIGMLCAFLG